MGVYEIAQRLGVGRQRAGILAKQKGFPDPVDILRMGKVWRAEDVEKWIAENRPALAEDPETN